MKLKIEISHPDPKIQKECVDAIIDFIDQRWGMIEEKIKIVKIKDKKLK